MPQNHTCPPVPYVPFDRKNGEKMVLLKLFFKIAVLPFLAHAPKTRSGSKKRELVTIPLTSMAISLTIFGKAKIIGLKAIKRMILPLVLTSYFLQKKQVCEDFENMNIDRRGKSKRSQNIQINQFYS